MPKIVLTRPRAVVLTSREQLWEEFRLCDKMSRISRGADPTNGKQRTKEQVAKYLSARIRAGEESVLEHGHVSAYFEISRAAFDQLGRHRLIPLTQPYGAAYTQESQRYVKFDDFYVVVPPTISNDRDALSTWKAEMSGAFDRYTWLISLGIPLEDARYSLPMATMTKVGITANLREWRAIIRLRCDKRAQWEIRNAVSVVRDFFMKNAAWFVDNL